MCSLSDFLCIGLLADYSLIRLHGVVVWEYEIVFNTKHFIINSKITTLSSRNHSAVFTYIYIDTDTSSCLLVSEDDRHTYIHNTHSHAWCRVYSHTYISGRASLKQFQECLYYIQIQVVFYWRFSWWYRAHIHTHLCLIACTSTHAHDGAFFFHTYRSVSLTRVPRYTQLAYLFHQRGKSLLSRDSRIADCTVRHLGVERPFSSLDRSFSFYVLIWTISYFVTKIFLVLEINHGVSL